MCKPTRQWIWDHRMPLMWLKSHRSQSDTLSDFCQLFKSYMLYVLYIIYALIFLHKRIQPPQLHLLLKLEIKPLSES